MLSLSAVCCLVSYVFCCCCRLMHVFACLVEFMLCLLWIVLFVSCQLLTFVWCLWSVAFAACPGHQNSPKALYSMVFGPKSLNIWVLRFLGLYLRCSLIPARLASPKVPHIPRPKVLGFRVVSQRVHIDHHYGSWSKKTVPIMVLGT